MEEELASEVLFPERIPTGEGILPSQEILHFVQTGIIRSAPDVTEDQVQPSSIDLRLSREAFRVRASFLPGRATTLLNKAKSNGMFVEKLDISNSALIEPGVIYIIPLMESLELPSDVYGVANPKSTTGRLDIFTRLITEYGDEFERVRRGYRGGLYIEVVSQTFPIIIREGMKLNQLRFGRGRRGVVGEDRLKQLGQADFLIDPDDEQGQAKIDRGLRLTVDLEGNGSNVVGYKAKKHTKPIDLGLTSHYEAADFWEPLCKGAECILAPGDFYILASKQRVRVPADLAAEMLPYDLATQEFRVHYAGFFDPGFGYGRHGEIPGTRAVLEVRANEMPILLEHDQFVGRLNYYNMSEIPEKVYGGLIGSSYQQQGLALSKQFKTERQIVSSSDQGNESRRGGGGNSLKQNAHNSEDEDEMGRLALTFSPSSTEHGLIAKDRSE
jgi:dCTP deaminase